MAIVVMYATRFCPYCMRARQLFQAKGVVPEEIAVDYDADRRTEMQHRSGRSSVPQIFIDNRHVGGYMDLWRLEQAGELDGLLGLSGGTPLSEEETP